MSPAIEEIEILSILVIFELTQKKKCLHINISNIVLLQQGEKGHPFNLGLKYFFRQLFYQ